MSYFVYGAGIFYPQYLQAKSLVSDICWEISQNTLATVGTTNQIRALGLEVRQSNEALATIHGDLQSINASINELTALFDWHMSELLLRVGHIADTLDELLEIAKTPEQTWAYEQYEMARTAFRRRLIPEALSYLEWATNGHGGRTGNKIEHRFHHLRGVIRLGDNRDKDEHCDLSKAEQAFVEASRCARVDYPVDAAVALVAAAYAAYCQGRVEEAIAHAQKAALYAPDLGETHYLHAKRLFHANQELRGLASLKSAIYEDALYAVKCMADADFLKFSESINRLIQEIQLNLRRYYSTPAGATVIIARVHEHCVQCDYATEQAELEEHGRVTTDNWSKEIECLAMLQQLLVTADANVRSDTFMGALSAAYCIREVEQLIHRKPLM